MKKSLLLVVLAAFLAPVSVRAQFESFKDSVVQLYGVVMTADSLRGIPAVTVKVRNQNRGTYTNDQGVFSIVVLKGDIIDFTSVGFKPKEVLIPRNLEGNRFSIIQLMVVDTIYLPATIIRARPSREQFERDFVNTPVPADKIEIARRNTLTAQSRILMQSLPKDGGEAANYSIRNAARSTYYSGQFRPQPIFSPLAWAEFIDAWKRGDFKSKK
ncbi:MAG TPA: carboxypeptidase-like regulatory domain-containing protein [Lacibacter sp.]|nr:carboxypeptidase-like regulatory domain-containing protein [Lacibacter sp.]HMO87554.1 carboxypeptidase-like regulatory domain-containing protein [Lacibacter sp.]